MKIKEITKENLEQWFDPVYDYENDGVWISFKSEIGYDEITEVNVSEDCVSIPNGGGFGGGYSKDHKIESAEDIYDALLHACDEEEGWECY